MLYSVLYELNNELLLDFSFFDIKCVRISFMKVSLLSQRQPNKLLMFHCGSVLFADNVARVHRERLSFVS